MGAKIKSLSENISVLFKKKDWKTLIKNYQPKDISLVLSYKDSMFAAKEIMEFDFRNDETLNYVVDLLFSVRNRHQKNWNEDWKNDIFLSDLCAIVWRYKESYEVLASAYQRIKDPSAAFLYEFAKCTRNPPEAKFMSEEEAEELLQESLNKKITFETANFLSWIYTRKNNKEKALYWSKIANEAEKKCHHNENLVPEFYTKVLDK
ncbi:MAG: hypothetical protein Tsb0021_04070 [Chlamydiales bacterium]